MDIAVFGGTFDPPTVAHEAIMRAVLQRDDIDELWVMPSAYRTDKPYMSDNDVRLAMLTAVQKESFNNSPKLRISDFEMKLPYNTETYLTLNALRETFPSHKFSFIFGADSYSDMPHWRNGLVLQKTMGMLLVARQGYTLPSESATIRHLQVPGVVELAISSTDVRNAVAENCDIDGFVSSGVANCIHSNELYKQVQYDACK
jgi:nicotinate-nucleotide adenylyltransferase